MARGRRGRPTHPPPPRFSLTPFLGSPNPGKAVFSDTKISHSYPYKRLSQMEILSRFGTTMEGEKRGGNARFPGGDLYE